RDRNVTGVQTCALPILKKGQPFEIEKICERIEQAVWALSMQEKNVPIPTMPLYRHQMTELCYSSQELASYQPIWCTFDDAVGKRSEERRVGNECGHG